MSRLEREPIPVAVIGQLVPIWLEQEAAYSYAKAASIGAPITQDNALDGGLEKGNPAYLEHRKYLSGFSFYAMTAGEDEHLKLLASRELGKYTGAGRSLCTVIAAEIQDYPDFKTADREIVMPFIEERALGFNTVSYKFTTDVLLDHVDKFDGRISREWPAA